MKKLKNLISFLLVAVILVSLAAMGGSALAIEEPEIDAEAAILVELGSHVVLYSKNADEERDPASTTKMMTILLAVEAIERGEAAEDDMVVVSENVSDGLTDSSVTVELEEGEEMSLLNLLYCAALPSANDACNVIAEHISGSIENFVRLMNSRAAELGCDNTNFVNPHGMPAEDHYSTAHDLYLILNEAYTHELFAKLTGTDTYTVPSTETHMQRSLINTDKLLSKESEYYYQDIVCGKTGSSDSSGYCLAAVGNDNKLTLISVVLGAEYKKNDNGVRVYKHFTETRSLMEWGFDNFSYRPILDESNLLADVPVKMGEGTDSVVLRPEKSITMLVENDVSTDNELSYDITVYSEVNGEDLIAPVYSGDVLGEVEVFYKGDSQGVVKLVANTTVPLMRTEYLKSEFKRGLSSKWIKGTIWFLVLVLLAYIAYIIYYNAAKRKRRRAAAAKAEAGYPQKPRETASASKSDKGSRY